MLKLVIGKGEDVPAFRAPRAIITRLFEEMMRGEKRTGSKGQVNLVFVSDHRISELNREFRGKKGPTDVLSFNLDEPDNADAVFGEIYISAPTARRQAAEHGVSLTNELVRLTCHGLLHLLGYDHERSNEEASRMAAREAEYTGRIGT